MTTDRASLESLGREELIAEARQAGVKRAEVMTRVELIDELLRLATPNPVERRRVRGWLGVARDLLASVVEQGLHLPDAAALIRGDVRFEPLRPPQPPVATVTLAEIYGAQGHFGRALSILDEVLAKEPDHEVASRLRERLSVEREGRVASVAASTSDARPSGTLEPEESAPPSDELPTIAPPAAGDVSPAPEVAAPARVAREAETGPSPPPPVADSPAEPLPRRRRVAILARPSGSTCTVFYDLGGAAHGLSCVVRVVEHRPRAGGAERVEREIDAPADRGTAVINGIRDDAVVRAAVGVVDGGVFRALAVAAEVALDGPEPRVLWASRPRVDPAAILMAAEALRAGTTA